MKCEKKMRECLVPYLGFNEMIKMMVKIEILLQKIKFYLKK